MYTVSTITFYMKFCISLSLNFEFVKDLCLIIFIIISKALYQRNKIYSNHPLVCFQDTCISEVKKDRWLWPFLAVLISFCREVVLEKNERTKTN